MASTATYTCREICTDALRKAGIVAHDDPATADEIDTAKRSLNRMVKAWQTKGVNLWAYADMSVGVTTNANYTLDPVRPLSITNCNLKRNGSELPMSEMTRDEYKTLPNKASTGTPTQFYYDRQREAAVLYVWPVAATASGTLEISYVREFEDVGLDDAIDVPSEVYDAAVYGLADRLVDDFPGQIDPNRAQKIMARAEALWRDVEGFDREGSVFFAPDEYA